MSAAESPRMRLGVMAIVIVALFAALFARLWYLQVLSSQDYVQAAEANRIRVVQVEAPRGRILDRNGTVLVDNRVSTIVTVDRVQFLELADDDQAGLLNRLAAEMSRYGSPATVEQLLDRVNNQRYSRYAPVPVAQDVTEQLKIYIEEHEELFPSVAVRRVALRRYNYGTRAAHLLGYVGEINDTELADRADKPKTYIQGNQIGKSGVERLYEDDLRGTPGQTVYEVDAQGRPVRVLEDRSRPPIPGDDVWLTIDVTTQALSEDLLEQALEAARARNPRGSNVQNEATGGSVVVLDPTDGSVRAMASYPTYDPADFINGISSSRYAFLTGPGQQPAAHQPGHPGPVRAGLHVQTGHLLRRTGQRAPVADDALRRHRQLHDPRVQRRAVHLPQRRRDPLRHRRPAARHHRVVRRVLLLDRRRLLEQPRSPRRRGPPGVCSALRLQPADRGAAAGRGGWAHPVARAAPAPVRRQSGPVPRNGTGSPATT